jgi:LCP family protein required for cell wall assembly
VSNRGYSSNSRRKPKKRITGRFYAFLTIIVVLVVMFVVFLTQRGSQSVVTTNPDLPTPTPASDQWSEEDAETPAPEATDGATSIDELIDSDPDLAPLEGDQKVQVSDLSITEGLPAEWHNILLLGSDTRNIKKVSRTDTIIIASINTNDGRIKLTSIMRDTVVPIPGHGDKKINSASYYGGPELTMKVVNECFKMNISEYLLVNFGSFKEIVDTLGGIKLDVTEEEMEQINGSIKEQARILNLSKEKWLAGDYNLKDFGADIQLDGLQALAYARIRHIDSDWQRTERQRKVIDAAIQKFRGSVSIKQLVQLATSVWDYIKTNVNMPSAIGLAQTVLKSGVGKVSTGLLPMTDTYKSESRSANGAALYDTDFAANSARLYKFIYEE